VQCQYLLIEQQTAPFTRIWEATVKPKNLDDYSVASRGIWQHFPWKTVGPSDELFTANAVHSILLCVHCVSDVCSLV